jgi:excinuclease UvrABC ATPase subunit
MLYLMITFFLSLNLSQAADTFETEAKVLVAELKLSLMTELSEKISKDGAVEAIPFCHINVKSLAKQASKGKHQKYDFGRTSQRIRNDFNKAEAWAEKYLAEFQGTKKGDKVESKLIHTLDNGKRVYLEPLYVEAKCLTCHGENINKDIETKIKSFYPNDRATGYKLGDFRGFIWIKEKAF